MGRVRGWDTSALRCLDWLPQLQSVVACAPTEKVVKRSIDPSKPLPFWDKVCEHGTPGDPEHEHSVLCRCV